MYFLWLMAAVAVAGIGWGVRRRSALGGQALIAIGCVGCLAALGWLVRQNLFAPDAQPPNRAHAVVGFFLANHTQREIAGQRGTVVLILPPESILDSRTAETYVNSFRAPLLRGQSELELQVAALEIPPKIAKAGNLPLTAFEQVMAKFPNALAFVSYAGVPPDIASLVSAGQGKHPPFLLFDPHRTTNWVGALKQNQIRCVIVPRPDVDLSAMPGISGMPGEIFGQLYLLATPETADRIAAQLQSARSK
jgi:hypothetical protein